MSSFLLALQFLTVLPLKVKQFNEKRMAWSLVFFPVVGLFLGLILVVLNMLLSALGILPAVVNIILVIALIILTGGMHMDGLSDTADAFLSGKGKEEMLKIMRDPHIGVMGVLSLIICILLKIGLLSSLAVIVKPAALILMCILSRWTVVMVMYLFPYARQEGKAKFFMQGLNLKILISSLVLVLVFLFSIWGLKGWLILLIVSGCAYSINVVIAKKIGGVTGDTLGATIEIMEAVILLTVCITQGFRYG
ncbi:MAG: adenosylcobinamide-GDP ribazoletransferase [Candidatus Omnitrophica bacterium]|nr:adenosylcobinamide-GDP ribazoletransferase [Candidatus Omnitrophota bacterium]